MYVHKNIYTKMFLAALLVKAKIGNIPNACEQKDKLSCVHTIEYSAMKERAPASQPG